MRSAFDDSKWLSTQLPISKLAKKPDDSAVMVLRKTFDCDAAYKKPVLRVTIGRIDTDEQPQEKLDGFQRRLSMDFPIQIHLNGNLLRKASFHALDGQTAIGYLPLLSKEADLMKNTGNVLAVVVQKTNQIESFDIRLQEMVEIE